MSWLEELLRALSPERLNEALQELQVEHTAFLASGGLQKGHSQQLGICTCGSCCTAEGA